MYVCNVLEGVEVHRFSDARLLLHGVWALLALSPRLKFGQFRSLLIVMGFL